jgi:hypothetical protein
LPILYRICPFLSTISIKIIDLSVLIGVIVYKMYSESKFTYVPLCMITEPVYCCLQLDWGHSDD